MRNGFHPMPLSQERTDEELMQQLAAGAQEALGPLYSRYARLIFHLAVRSLDRPAAEEIVQEVFLAVWRGAATFDPARGTFRHWVLQITHFRILNELRRRSRQPQLEPDPEDLYTASLPDDSPEPAEAIWRASLRSMLQAALAELPAPQRQALDLAFDEDLTHEQVAATLNVPLGTAKTRIRSGLQNLRGKLLPQLAAAALLGLLVFFGLRYHAEQLALRRDERALALLTASDTENLRLGPAPGIPPETHARYRGRTGTAMAVVTFSNFPPAPVGRTYQVWVRHQGRWTSLGTIQPDASGAARLLAEDPALVTLPEVVQVTLEPAKGSTAPSGPVVVVWSEQ